MGFVVPPRVPTAASRASHAERRLMAAKLKKTRHPASTNAPITMKETVAVESSSNPKRKGARMSIRTGQPDSASSALARLQGRLGAEELRALARPFVQPGAQLFQAESHPAFDGPGG